MRQKITFLLFAVLATVLTAQTVSIQGGSSYMTIQEAIDDSIDNDVILIDGTFTEVITIANKSITLRGDDPTNDIIQAAGSASSDEMGSRVISLSASSTDPDPLPVLTITIENLGIRYGNSSSADNGGGINADKITGLLTLKNLIIENNHTGRNGGGLGLAGCKADIIDCTIQNNSSTLDGGGLIAAPSNGAGINNVINIQQSLIDTNNGRNGGGIYINGNKDFGNDYLIDVNIENSTISNNTTFSGMNGNGGGAIFSLAQTWTTNAGGDGSSSNLTLKLVHVTTYNNSHSNAVKAGLQFGGANTTNFSAYNSIIVAADDVATKALNFAATNTTEVKNCIMGGIQNGDTGFLDDASRNNKRGYTATAAGLTGTLADNGGSTQTIAIIEDVSGTNSSADDFCTADTGLTLPTVDQRGYLREGVNDAGAYEYGGTLSVGDIAVKNQYKVFPNPARDWVNIVANQAISAIKVYSILGSLEKEVYNQKVLKVSDLSAGLHVMVIESGGQSEIKRIVVE